MLLNEPVAAGAHKATPLSGLAMTMIALAFLAPFLFYFDTTKSIVDVWNSSETFAHGYIILPISLWLIWRRRANFSVLPPTPWWPALGLLLIVGAGWMLARMGEVQVVAQYAFVAMLPVIALAMFGRRLAWSLAFPLLFLLFAVPFGEIFIGPLIEFTADFTIWAVQATGIPVLRNGTRFELPTGSWSVVEACSGVRYLISSVTIGCLYAYLTYRSTTRRVVFILMSIVMPILANGLRAFMIVMIGHHSDMTLATGVDHLIYGWIFFGIVMFLMFWVGSYWRQDTDAESLALSNAPAAAANPGRLRNMAIAVAAACALWPSFVKYNDTATFNPKPVALAPVQVSWAPSQPFTTWTPDFHPADATYSAAFRQDGQQPVALKVLYYRNQHRNKAVISSINRLAGEKNDFHEAGGALRTEQIDGSTMVLRESRMQGPSGNFRVWQWFWIDGQPVTNAYIGKLRQAKIKLLFGGDDGAAVMVAAPHGENADEARTALRAFLGAHLKAIDTSLAATRSN
jgi:exosortase A